MRNYHERVTKRANDAAATGMGAVLAAMQWDAALWAIPALLAVVLCWAFQLSGVAALFVAVPLIAVSLFGCVLYLGIVYGCAIKRR